MVKSVLRSFSYALKGEIYLICIYYQFWCFWWWFIVINHKLDFKTKLFYVRRFTKYLIILKWLNSHWNVWLSKFGAFPLTYDICHLPDSDSGWVTCLYVVGLRVFICNILITIHQIPTIYIRRIRNIVSKVTKHRHYQRCWVDFLMDRRAHRFWDVLLFKGL